MLPCPRKSFNFRINESFCVCTKVINIFLKITYFLSLLVKLSSFLLDKFSSIIEVNSKAICKIIHTSNCYCFGHFTGGILCRIHQAYSNTILAFRMLSTQKQAKPQSDDKAMTRWIHHNTLLTHIIFYKANHIIQSIYKPNLFTKHS